MTLILGIEDPQNNRAVMACDSGAWKGDQLDRLAASKIWRSNGWILGLTGGWGHAQRAQRIELADPIDNAHDYMAESKLLDWLDKLTEECAKRNETVRRIDPNEQGSTPALIAAHDSRIWYVCDTEATRVARGYQAAGCPAYALGAMAALRHTNATRSATEDAEVTMRSVEQVTRAVMGPFRWLATDGTGGEWP